MFGLCLLCTEGALHQVVGMFPARRGRDPVQPSVNIGPFCAIKTKGFLVEEITTAGGVGDRDLIANDPIAPLEVVIQDAISRPETPLHKADHLLGAFFGGQKIHQEPGHPGLTRQFVIVPQEPTQHFTFVLGRRGHQLARFFTDIGLDRAGLGDGLIAVQQNGDLTHGVYGAKFRGAAATVEKINMDWGPVNFGQCEGQRRFVRVAALAEAIEFGHWIEPPALSFVFARSGTVQWARGPEMYRAWREIGGVLCFTELWLSVLLGRFLVGLRKSIFEAREAVHQGRVVQQAG